jgi:uncharacterized protein (TIGR04551 family)
MSRLLAAIVAASFLLPSAAGAQTPPPAQSKQVPPATTPTPRVPTPGSAAGGANASATATELDPAVRELVRREVEKAKEDMRDEIRAEVQGAQSAREFMDTAVVGERPKLDFLQLNGYLRVRGDLFDNLDLHRAADPSGYFLFPRPLRDADNRGTLTSDNMRFRVEPTFNVSEQIRVLSQIDMLDNIVLGSTPQGLFARSDGVLFPFDARGQVPPADGVNSDRNSIVVKRAWAEVQTPLGLLSFGRMPSSWGLGILANAASGIDDDYGDSVDRVQFALTPLKTPIGSLVLIPMYEIVATGVTSQDLRYARGLGQPFDRDPSDDAKAIGIKIVRTDTEEEMKRKFERGEASVSFGAWYMYKSQGYEFPQWVNGGAVPPGSSTPPAVNPTTPPSTGSPNPNVNDPTGTAVHRDAYAHTLDLWGRYQTRRFRLEGELVGIVGQIGNGSIDPTGLGIGPILLRQFGGAAQAGWKFLDGKLTLGAEAGFATGDSNPGFGVRPGRNCATTLNSATGQSHITCTPTKPGDIDGAQFAPGDKVLDIRNYVFNPAYRIDLVLWRTIIGAVTDAWYAKPTIRYELLDGLAGQASIIYSQAMYASSTPSQVHTPLGIEFDVGVSYQSDDGFIAWFNYGLLQPLDGLGYAPGQSVPGRDLTRANAFRGGLAVKF